MGSESSKARLTRSSRPTPCDVATTTKALPRLEAIPPLKSAAPHDTADTNPQITVARSLLSVISCSFAVAASILSLTARLSRTTTGGSEQAMARGSFLALTNYRAALVRHGPGWRQHGA